MTDKPVTDAMVEAVRAGCVAADVHLACSYPTCTCTAIPKAVRAALSPSPQVQDVEIAEIRKHLNEANKALAFVLIPDMQRGKVSIAELHIDTAHSLLTKLDREHARLVAENERLKTENTRWRQSYHGAITAAQESERKKDEALAKIADARKYLTQLPDDQFRIPFQGCVIIAEEAAPPPPSRMRDMGKYHRCEDGWLVANGIVVDRCAICNEAPWHRKRRRQRVIQRFWPLIFVVGMYGGTFVLIRLAVLFGVHLP